MFARYRSLFRTPGSAAFCLAALVMRATGFFIVLAAVECVPLPLAGARDPIVTPPIDVWLAAQPRSSGP